MNRERVADTITYKRCVKCGKGTFKYIDVYVQVPSAYYHVCDTCGERAIFDREYPYTTEDADVAGNLGKPRP